MESVIAAVVLLVIIGLAGLYVYKAKKQGEQCIGCPHSKTCASRKNGCGCGGAQN